MKYGRVLIFSVLLVLSVSACAPAVNGVQEQTPAVGNAQSNSTQSVTGEVPLSESTLVVTPRGDKLVATDPSSVDLASGSPLLVEFFRFT